ncbi:hypothetical protein BsWGS_23102 [Bradybaena similaris]
MMFIRKISPLILACLITVSHVTAGDPGSGMSEITYNFLSTFNGVLSSLDPDKLIQVRNIPLALPALGPNPFVLVEEAYNGDVHILQLCEVTERNGTIFLTEFNFTDAKYKFGEFNPDSLSTLRREDMNTDAACEITVVPDGDNVFVAEWPDCKDFVTGERPTYGVTVTCDARIVSVPVGARETNTRKPYKVNFTGTRFPVSGAPDNYASPCEKH